LISALPGLEHSEQNQQERIKALEEELEKEERKRKVAVKEKDVLLAKLDEVIRSVRRP
jgi:mediator of RNA polymerase II transcription subunit 21